MVILMEMKIKDQVMEMEMETLTLMFKQIIIKMIKSLKKQEMDLISLTCKNTFMVDLTYRKLFYLLIFYNYI